MPFFDVFKSKFVGPEPDQASFTQPTNTSGLVVVSELEKALDECKATVLRIAKQCRANNEKFRYVARPNEILNFTVGGKQRYRIRFRE